MSFLLWIAGFFSLLGFVPYIRSVLSGETRPHLMTWIIWTLVGALIAASYFQAGAPPLSLIVPIAYVVGPFIVTLLALRNGELGYNLFDIVCFVSALIALSIWIATGNPVLALALNIGVEFFGSLPTVRKVYFDPQSENLSAWILFVLANGLNLLGQNTWNVIVLSYPFYLFVMSSFVTFLIVSRPKKISANSKN